MGDKVWVVERQMEFSEGDGFTDNYAVSSIHRTEKGAKDQCAKLKQDELVYAITRSEMDAWNNNPDEIVGALESIGEDDLLAAVKAGAAMPGADFLGVLEQVCDDHGIDRAHISVSSRPLSD